MIAFVPLGEPTNLVEQVFIGLGTMALLRLIPRQVIVVRFFGPGSNTTMGLAPSRRIIAIVGSIISSPRSE